MNVCLIKSFAGLLLRGNLTNMLQMQSEWWEIIIMNGGHDKHSLL